MFKNKINPDHISYKCTLKWDDLKDSKEGKYCNHCQENVFDLRDCSLEDVIQLQKKKGMVCGLVSTLAISSLLSTNSCAPLTQTMGTICPHRLWKEYRLYKLYLLQ